jgi:L-ascorbate metabolism protein UlaG (beta-lactamase superfamily)
MRITHYGHACVLVETASARLLFDPGSFSSGFEELRELDAVLITHQHVDHVDVDKLPGLFSGSPKATLYTDSGSADLITGLDVQMTVLHAGDSVPVAGASMNVVGGSHAVIHRDIPVIPNIGFMVDDGAFYHPGDSFFVPDQEIDVLGLPTGGPWLKLSEAVDFLRAAAPRVALPIHESILAYPQIHYTTFENLAPPGSTVRVLKRNEATTV